MAVVSDEPIGRMPYGIFRLDYYSLRSERAAVGMGCVDIISLVLNPGLSFFNKRCRGLAAGNCCIRTGIEEACALFRH